MFWNLPKHRLISHLDASPDTPHLYLLLSKILFYNKIRKQLSVSSFAWSFTLGSSDRRGACSIVCRWSFQLSTHQAIWHRNNKREESQRKVAENKENVKIMPALGMELRSYILCLGELSFPLMMKRGKNIENRHPLMMNDSQKKVRSASTNPKPMK